MSQFATAVHSQTEAIGAVADLANQVGQSAYLARTTGAITLTAAQLINGIVVQSGTPGAFNMTLPTAAAIVAAIKNCQIGSSFEFTLVNNGDATITIVTGDGVTLVGTTAVPTSKSQIYKGVVTAVDTPAANFVGILKAPV